MDVKSLNYFSIEDLQRGLCLSLFLAGAQDMGMWANWNASGALFRKECQDQCRVQKSGNNRALIKQKGSDMSATFVCIIDCKGWLGTDANTFL